VIHIEITISVEILNGDLMCVYGRLSSMKKYKEYKRQLWN
jgi:hypothetical protein